MVDTAHKQEDGLGGNGYVQFSLAWALALDQRTRERILTEKDNTPQRLAAAIAHTITYNQPMRLLKVCPPLLCCAFMKLFLSNLSRLERPCAVIFLRVDQPRNVTLVHC